MNKITRRLERQRRSLKYWKKISRSFHPFIMPAPNPSSMRKSNCAAKPNADDILRRQFAFLMGVRPSEISRNSVVSQCIDEAKAQLLAELVKCMPPEEDFDDYADGWNDSADCFMTNIRELFKETK